MTETKKKASKKKAKKIDLPKKQDRFYGNTVFTCQATREEASKLISDFGFVCHSDAGDICYMVADEEAYEKMRAAK